MRDLLYLKDVVTLKLNGEKCVGCGMCLLVCPRGVLGPKDGKIEILNRDACIECGACARNCPARAFSVRTGVGCAAAVINSLLGKKNASCCSIEDACSDEDSSSLPAEPDRSSCC